MQLRAVVLALLVGCVGETQLATPQSQVKALLGNDRIGHIDAGFTSASPQPRALLANDTYKEWPLTFLGIDDGKICFRAHRNMAKAFTAEEEKAQLTKRTYVIAIHEDLKELQAMSAWPSAGPGFVSIEVVSDNVVGDDRRGPRRKVEIEMCGAAPSVTEKTKYLTVMSLPHDDYLGQMYMWAVGE